MTLAHELAKRRTFAIISHPDAGKTTITEKMLLYGGAIHLAGAVRARRSSRHATSDWMSIEKQRGISVSTSVMQFPFEDKIYNLLDTPGHEDFSEDTYRTLAAADCAIMLIDAAKGVEAQTRKLFEVCRLRAIPIITFMNKMDRDGRDPLELMEEVEKLLGIHCTPWNWPIGQGPDFRGVVEVESGRATLFERGGDHGTKRVQDRESSLDDPALPGLIGETSLAKLRDELELVREATPDFTREDFLSGEITPVFFGSALNNFGVEPFLSAFGRLAPRPGPRETDAGPRQPDAPDFSGFVFKIQANMDKNHRDRIAFLRLCSGSFERGMAVRHQRLRKEIRLNNATTFFAQERVKVETAVSGDIIGLHDTGLFQVGDTLTAGGDFRFAGIPTFCPELFARVLAPNPLKRKRLDKGLRQLSDEGAIQLLYPADNPQAPEPVLAAVGQLQFEVLTHRMNEEYDVEVRIEPMPYGAARWVDAGDDFDWRPLMRSGISTVFRDIKDRWLVAFRDEWTLQHSIRNLENVVFQAAAPDPRN